MSSVLTCDAEHFVSVLSEKPDCHARRLHACSSSPAGSASKGSCGLWRLTFPPWSCGGPSSIRPRSPPQSSPFSSSHCLHVPWSLTSKAPQDSGIRKRVPGREGCDQQRPPWEGANRARAPRGSSPRSHLPREGEKGHRDLRFWLLLRATESEQQRHEAWVAPAALLVPSRVH